ncbi:MAG: redoxin domain-containing protein, partial [Gemmatimonadales bacterium]
STLRGRVDSMRRALWMAVLVAATARAGAQAPATPDGCIKTAGNWFNQAYKAARDSAALPGGKPVNVSALLAQRDTRLAECASQFSIASTNGPGLIALSGLYTQLGRDSLAMAAVDKRLAEPGISTADSASALVTMISALTRPDTVAILRAEPYMARLDAMPDAVVLQKIAAHARLNGEYRYLDVDSRIRQHSLAIIALAKHLKVAPSTARGPDVLNAFDALIAYTDLAEVYGDVGQVDSALMVLDQAQRDHPEVTATDADEILAPERARYALVGKAAPPIAAGQWLNSPEGTRVIDPGGKITVVEFTAHWCIPCRNSYPAMADMAARFEAQGVQFVFATQFYGYFGQQRGLSPAAELAADREYFIAEHGIHFPVGIADQPVQSPNAPYLPNPNDAAYHVGGIPQTVVIDRNGIVRRIVTGWDTGNAERLPVLLAALLHEPDSRTPE